MMLFMLMTVVNKLILSLPYFLTDFKGLLFRHYRRFMLRSPWMRFLLFFLSLDFSLEWLIRPILMASRAILLWDILNESFKHVFSFALLAPNFFYTILFHLFLIIIKDLVFLSLIATQFEQVYIGFVKIRLNLGCSQFRKAVFF